jgi:hypothetical protein
VASRGQFSADILVDSSGLRFTVALGKSYQDTDPAYLIRLLRARRERPRSRRAAGQCDELAAPHVWMAPAWQEIISPAAQKSLAVMCPASHDSFSVKG